MGTYGERFAQHFHETYERLAPQFGYKTRDASAVPWADVPAPNKALMIAVASEVIAAAFEEAADLVEHGDPDAPPHRAGIWRSEYKIADAIRALGEDD